MGTNNESITVVLSFVGTMPPYIIECITQLRHFYSGPIYIIYSSMSDAIRETLCAYNCTLVEYDTVKSDRFDSKFLENDFPYVESLKGREHLFKRSYERFFLLETLMHLHNLQHIWFMELDVLLYTDPNVFLPILQTKPYVFAYHRENHCNTGIFYVRDLDSFQPILAHMLTFNGSFRSEMVAMHSFYMKHPDTTLFPLLTEEASENKLFWKDFQQFQNYLFDGAAMGIYLFGYDPHHTQGTIVRKNIARMTNHLLPIWKYGSIVWKQNEEGLFLPYFQKKDTDTLYPIANLHIHSKDLQSAVSHTPKDGI